MIFSQNHIPIVWLLPFLFLCLLLGGCRGQPSGSTESGPAENSVESDGEQPGRPVGEQRPEPVAQAQPAEPQAVSSQPPTDGRSQSEAAGPGEQDLRRWLSDLAGDDPQARASANEQLQQGGAQLQDRVLRLFDDRSAAVRRGAVFYLMDRFDRADPQMTEAFLATLQDEDSTVRHMGLRVVKRMPKQAVLEELSRVTGLLDPRREQPANRAEVARFLASLQSEASQALPALTRSAQADPVAAVRSACLLAVFRIAEPSEAVDVLEQSLLADQDAAVRRVAATRLRQLGPQAAPAAPALGQALHDADPQVRRAATEALVAMGPPAVPVLVEQLESPDARARELAVAGLGYLGRHARPAVPALEQRLEDDDPAVRRLAEAVLQRLGAATP